MYYSMDVIAHIHNDYKEKFGIPRQSGLVPAMESRIIFTEKYNDPEALKGLDDFSHLWLIWAFSEGFSSRQTEGNISPDVPDMRLATARHFSPTVRPPRLGGNERMGVFATRSPNRPNPIGLSVVHLSHIDLDTHEGPVIYVTGADLMDQTPILDIKPYIAYADAIGDANSSYASLPPDQQPFDVTGAELLPQDIDKPALIRTLSLDPRPAYHTDPDREYGIRFGKYDVKFKVSNDTVYITGCYIRL